ncbi:MAG: cell division protein FtsZ, partial [Pseudolabrys sp.]
AMPRAIRPMPQYERPPQRPTARPPEGRPAEPVSEYARRAAPQGLDPHGRSAPVHNSQEDDQLDIPAFLRRQAN